MDKDGKVSWAEWQGIMFHEDHQVPEFRDGHDLDDVVDPLSDDDIDPEELELIKTRFVKVDIFRSSSSCPPPLSRHRARARSLSRSLALALALSRARALSCSFSRARFLSLKAAFCLSQADQDQDGSLSLEEVFQLIGIVSCAP